MSKTKLLKVRLEDVEYEMKQILRLLKDSGIKYDAFCAGFSPLQGFYVNLPGNKFRGEEGEFLRTSELIRLEILFRKF